ncbi:hypothetical protein CVT25_014689 [Psilocybe cyanescens]|uniref:Uncharacterized protein n=1 Tax=Psilocybe cyanescens TaxID=93625 RepID=A0A409WTW2_PSICY|nr:hypothetical protein CVT25_014689 [Psilocybe cyanescens]
MTVDAVRWNYRIYLLPNDNAPPSNVFGTIGDIAKVGQGQVQGNTKEDGGNERGGEGTDVAFWIRETRKWIKADTKLDAGGKPCQKHPLLKGKYRLDRGKAKWKSANTYYAATKLRNLAARGAGEGVCKMEVRGQGLVKDECVPCTIVKKEPIYVDLSGGDELSKDRGGESQTIFIDLSSEENWQARGITLTLPRASSSRLTLPPALHVDQQENGNNTNTNTSSASASKVAAAAVLTTAPAHPPNGIDAATLTSDPGPGQEREGEQPSPAQVLVDNDDMYVNPPDDDEAELQYPHFDELSSGSQPLQSEPQLPLSLPFSQPQLRPQLSLLPPALAYSYAYLQAQARTQSLGLPPLPPASSSVQAPAPAPALSPSRQETDIHASTNGNNASPDLSSSLKFSRLEAKLDRLLAKVEEDRREMMGLVRGIVGRLERLERLEMSAMRVEGGVVGVGCVGEGGRDALNGGQEDEDEYLEDDWEDENADADADGAQEEDESEGEGECAPEPDKDADAAKGQKRSTKRSLLGMLLEDSGQMERPYKKARVVI